jgi:MFS family permease
MLAGWLADRFDKGRLLASGYFVAGIMAVAVILLPANIWTLAAIFAIGGIYVAIEETLEDSWQGHFCAGK